MSPASDAATAAGCRPGANAFAAQHQRAPRTDGATLIEPPLSAVPALVADNVALRATYDYDVQGRSLAQLATQARDEVLREAERYTRQYRAVNVPKNPARVFLAGHQPQMFHPGVWFKNFVLGGIASAHGGVGVNLAIDSDTVKSVALRVPTGTVDAPRAESVAYDDPTEEIPYEERAVINPARLAEFGPQAAATLSPLVPDPLLTTYWPRVLDRAAATGNLGAALAQARHQLEGDWGLATLELPQSRVCGLESFHWFAAHLLAQLPRLWQVYNTAVAEYRRAYHIRSANHPVPDLAAEGEWLEAPFWIWSDQRPRRQQLFVRQRGAEMTLTDRHGLEIALPLSPEADARRGVAILAELAGRGIKLRTRALLTTMFARLLVSDLFLHGIGGGKYDELTDLLVTRFFGLRPPGFLVVSATRHLPIAHRAVTADDVRRVEHELRELEYHPDRFMSAQSNPPREAAALVAEKARWLAIAPDESNAAERHRALLGANAGLQPFVSARRGELQEEREKLSRQLRGARVLESREYAFCLYPEQSLRNFLLDFRSATP